MSEGKLNQLAMLIKPALDRYRGGVIARDEDARATLDEIVEVLYIIGHVIVPERPSDKMMNKVYDLIEVNPQANLAAVVYAANRRDNVKKEDQ